MSLRPNQQQAIKVSLDNDFESGIHFHATGTGKSWISLELILQYHGKYPDHNIFWICEQKSILIEQFSQEQLRSKGYNSIFQKFIIHNYSEHKLSTWHESVNTSKFWKKPILVIINRAFLVSQDKYKLIKIPIHLIIHDECHSISNQTTRDFYNYMVTKEQQCPPKCLGFSATPNTDFQPFTNILSSYSIYDAYLDRVIVPPKIVWYSSHYNIDIYKMMDLIKPELEKLYYQKIIVWCGLIEECYKLSQIWKEYFPEYSVYTDTSENSGESGEDQDYQKFYQRERMAILFCACKHREGSDIKNLDGCIFFDKVQNRTPRTFIQCIGRVLRVDPQGYKQYGLIVDFNAQSSIKICDRVNEFLYIDEKIFPWNYQYQYLLMGSSKKKVTYHQLTFTKEIINDSNVESLERIINSDYTLEYLQSKFIRSVTQEKYLQRLSRELKIIEAKKLIGHLILAVKILEITEYIPHVTRGSCGSSLVCYLLGISHIDPIKYKVSFARFLNEYRDNLPDIDFDFPHFLRDDVFIKLYQKWPGMVARISNHVYYHQKSAQREALRMIGIRKFIPKNDMYNEIKKLTYSQKNQFDLHVKRLDKTFKNYSLHCGGIIFFPNGIPEKFKLDNKKTMSQVILNKMDVAESKQFKIDILSSRALSQLYYASTIIKKQHRLLEFDYFENDSDVFEMLANGNNLGVTLAESPLMRKALMMVKPTSIHELAICLSIIRPAAKDARMSSDYDNKFVFDDDAIQMISQIMNCDEELADKYRRGFAKSNQKVINQLTEQATSSFHKKLLEQLKNLRCYSFCKSHALSYAQLVWKLAYLKKKYPKAFWKSTLLYTQTSYKKWVHYYEAHLVGINFHHVLFQKDKSVYSNKKKEKFSQLSCYEQLRQYGYWDIQDEQFFPNCYFLKQEDKVSFRGIIASSRVLSHNKKSHTYNIVYFIGVGKGHYIEVLFLGSKYSFKDKYIGLYGQADTYNKKNNCYETTKVNLF